MMCMLGLSIASCKQGCEIAADDAEAAIEGDEVDLVHVKRCNSGCFESSYVVVSTKVGWVERKEENRRKNC